MTRIKSLLVILILVPGLLLPGTGALASELSIKQSMRTAEHQRMLTQRVVKAYAMLGQQVDTDEARLQLAEATALFELQHEDLVTAAPDERVREALTATEAAWSQMQAITQQVPNRDDAWQLYQTAGEAMTALNSVILRLQQAANSIQGRLVQVAGSQQMLSQRLAALYMLKSWGIENPTLNEQYRQATVDFAHGLEQLLASSTNTRQIRIDLKRVKAQWSMFQRSAHLREDAYVPLLVNSASERILRMMDTVTGLYSDLAGSTAG